MFKQSGFIAAVWASIIDSLYWSERTGLTMPCIRCGSNTTRQDGSTKLGGQRWRWSTCRRRFTVRSTSAFSRHGFPDDLIALALRWNIRFRLSYTDVGAWLAERGVMVDRRFGPARPAAGWGRCAHSPASGRCTMARRRVGHPLARHMDLHLARHRSAWAGHRCLRQHAPHCAGRVPLG